jgi:CheY-like chemotaxis protein
MKDRLAGLRVLVVDDDEASRYMVEHALEHAGAIVTTVTSAAEAFAILERNPPNVIVSDITMPEESGIAFIVRVRALEAARAGRIPAVAFTSDPSPETHTLAIAAGFNAFLTRPFELDELVLVIARLVGRSKRPASPPYTPDEAL